MKEKDTRRTFLILGFGMLPVAIFCLLYVEPEFAGILLLVNCILNIFFGFTIGSSRKE